jgi:hypothetical protein
MSAAPALSWPSSRILLGWWRELADHQPQQLRVARLLLHRIEALVRVSRSRSLDRWQRALLGLASTRVPCGGELITSLNDLQMNVQLLGQLVRELTANGLLHRNGAGLWHMTAAGHRALETGAFSDSGEERRTFVFVDNSRRGLPPSFLPLRRPLPPGLPPASAEVTAYSFAVSHLEACLAQSAEWKTRHRFPADVEALLLPGIDDGTALDWRRVVFDAVTPQWFVFLDTAPANDSSSLLGFAVRPEDWSLDPKPLLALTESGQEALLDLFHEPTAELWRQAWREWATPRGLPPTDVEVCRLERVDHRLLVQVPPRAIERLRSARSDAIKQEAWLLAGEGPTRTAAQIELHPLT